MAAIAEAVLLGFASGPACVASCGPALLPWLVAERPSPSRAAGLLGIFLSGRLAGYLVFAVAAWSIGIVFPPDVRTRALLFGVADAGLGVTLALYAVTLGSARPLRCGAGCPVSRFSRLRQTFHAFAPAALGFLTGLNVCPPFIAAALRASQDRRLGHSLLFFTVFFLGTSVWTLPAIAAGALRRLEPAAFVARAAMMILAVYYAYLGVVSLTGRLLHA